MSEMILQFSTENYARNPECKDIIAGAVELTKMAMEKWNGKSVDNTAYERLNKATKDSVLTYAAKVSNAEGDVVNNFADYKYAVGNYTAFREAMFAIETKVIDTVNSKADVEQALLLAEVQSKADGDSGVFEIGSKSLYTVEDTGYSNNVSRLQYQFMAPIVLTPRPKDAAIAVDLYQFNTIGFDFGKQMAKIAMSFRIAMYDSILSVVFDTTPLIGTPFYKATFAKKTWQELANRVAGANGAPAMAYGTNIALGSASDTVGDKWAYGVSGEFVKNGFIRDIYGVNSMILNQAVNPNTSAYTFKVPDDKILITTPSTDRIAKLLMEGQTFVTNDDGRNNSINLKTYKYKQSWVTKIATQSAYAIQAV